MVFLKNFINVLSVASISFILLSAAFAFIVYFCLLDGKVKSKAGVAFIIVGLIIATAGLWFTPMFYLAIAYFLSMWGLATLGPRLWDAKTGLWLLIIGAGGFGLSLLDPNFKLIAAKPDNVPIGAMIFLLGIFTWIALRKAYLNDRQILGGGTCGGSAPPRRGRGPHVSRGDLWRGYACSLPVSRCCSRKCWSRC